MMTEFTSDMLREVLNYGFDRGVGAELTYKLKPYTPSVSNPETRWIAVNMNWHKPKQLPYQAALPHIRIHDLRHTHAVLMREAGLSLDDIKDDLGHKDISTTQIYAEISPAKKKENHQQFEKYLNQ